MIVVEVAHFVFNSRSLHAFDSYFFFLSFCCCYFFLSAVVRGRDGLSRCGVPDSRASIIITIRPSDNIKTKRIKIKKEEGEEENGKYISREITR